MADVFVSQLTDEQIRLFLTKEFPESRYSNLQYYREAQVGIRCSVEAQGIIDEEVLNIVLEDFEVRGAVDTTRWCQYLYGIFHESWEEAYIKHCLSKAGITE